MQNEKSISFVKLRRLVRRLPKKVYSEWFGVIANRGQFVSFGLAILTSYIGIQTATLPQIIDEATGWANAVQAFVYVSAAWFFVSVPRAAWLLIHEDRTQGRWYQNRFVYHDRKLVATYRCKATGAVQTFPVVFDNAVPLAFVHYEIIVGQGNVPSHLYSASMVGQMVLSSNLQPGQGASNGGFRIGEKMEAKLFVVMRPEAISQTVRVYCLDFTAGNPRDDDGDEGELWPYQPPAMSAGGA
jgi:hypothetical protein